MARVALAQRGRHGPSVLEIDPGATTFVVPFTKMHYFDSRVLAVELK